MTPVHVQEWHHPVPATQSGRRPELGEYVGTSMRPCRCQTVEAERLRIPSFSSTKYLSDADIMVNSWQLQPAQSHDCDYTFPSSSFPHSPAQTFPMENNGSLQMALLAGNKISLDGNVINRKDLYFVPKERWQLQAEKKLSKCVQKGSSISPNMTANAHLKWL